MNQEGTDKSLHHTAIRIVRITAVSLRTKNLTTLCLILLLKILLNLLQPQYSLLWDVTIGTEDSNEQGILHEF